MHVCMNDLFPFHKKPSAFLKLSGANNLLYLKNCIYILIWKCKTIGCYMHKGNAKTIGCYMHKGNAKTIGCYMHKGNAKNRKRENSQQETSQLFFTLAPTGVKIWMGWEEPNR